MSRVTRAVPVVLALVVGAGLAACKSGEGERCQVNADCAEGLVCTKVIPSTCVESVSGDADGGIDAPIDASELDGPEADAATDAAIDAATDAAIDAT